VTGGILISLKDEKLPIHLPLKKFSEGVQI